MGNYQNLRSKIKGKLPRPQDLEYGQLAVNFNDEEPFLSFVTDANEIAKVPTEKSITPLIESQVEEIVGEVVVEVVGTNFYNKTQSDERYVQKGETPTDVYTKAETDEKILSGDTAVKNWVGEQGYLTEHQSLADYYNKTEVDEKISSGDTAVKTWVGQQGYLTEHQSLDNYYTKSQSDEKYAVKGDVPTDVYTKAQTDEKIESGDTAVKNWVGEQGYLTEHQSLADYYTKTQVDTALNSKAEKVHTHVLADITDYEAPDLTPYETSQHAEATYQPKGDYALLSQIPDVSSYFNGAVYDSNTKRINFKHGDSVLAYIDATDFIKDGMVSNVEISGGNLVITFNSDAGKQPISIPLTDIFNPNNYYTKTEANTVIESGDTAVKTWVQSQNYLTEHQSLANYYTKSEVDTELDAKQDTLTAGSGITIENNVISATGGGSSITVDDTLSTESSNPVKNSAIANAINTKVQWIEGGRGRIWSDFYGELKYGLTSSHGTYRTFAAFPLINGKCIVAKDYDTLCYTSGYAGRNLQLATEAAFTGHTADTNSHVTAEEKASWNGKQDTLIAGEGISISGNTISATGGGGGSVTVDPALDINSENPVANSAITTSLNSKSNTGHTHTLSEITDYVAPDLTPYETSQHAEATYQPKGDYALLSQIPDVSSYFNGAVYDSEAKRINFKHGDSVLAYIDATDFIKDGMVSNVEISGGNLVITFNSDAGKQPISIPLTDIFNPNNYYTKSEANTVIESGCTEVKTWVGEQGYLTEHQSLANYYTKSEVDTELDAKQDTLTAGSGITIENNVISATGGGGGDIDEGMLEATANSLYTIRKELDADKENLAENYYNKSAADGKFQTKSDTNKNYFDKDYINERLDVIARGLVDLSENSGGGGGSVTVDPALDINSENPVANSAITTSLNSKSNTGHTHTLSEITDYVAPDLTPYETTSHASATFELKAWRGTQAQYDALETKDADRLYIITE